MSSRPKKPKWFRDEYADAVWETDALKANEVLVALAYADHAGNADKPRNDIAWVVWRRLSQRTGIRSRDALNRAIRGLEKAGWLVEVEAAAQHRSARYRLVIPERPEVRETYVWEEPADDPAVRLADNWDSPAVRETTPAVRETTSSSTGDGPDLSNRPLNHTAQPMAGLGAQPQDRAREVASDNDSSTRAELLDGLRRQLRGAS